MGVSEAMIRYMGGEPPWPAFALKRYSPRPQASVVWTEEWQDTAVSEACQFFDLTIVEEGVERLVSGRKARLRPVVERAKELAASSKIRAVVVGDWRRFSRDDPKRVLMLVASLQEQGVVIFSNAQRDLVPWEDLYWVKVAFYAEIANKEATSSAAAASRSIQEARNAGVAWGRTPIGWKRLDKVGNYTDVAERAAARRKSYFVADDSDGPRSMAVLQEAYLLRDGGWSFHALSRRLALPASSLRVALLGYVLADSTRSNARNRDAVGADLYDRVVGRGTGSAPVHTTRRPWYLRGLVRCPFCGGRMSGHEAVDRTGHAVRYYVCHDGDRRARHDWTHVREAVLVEELRRQLAALVFSGEQLRLIEAETNRPKHQRDIERRKSMRADVSRRIGRVNVQHEAGGLTDEQYRARLRELRAQLDAIPDDPPPAVVSMLSQHVAIVHQVAAAIPSLLDDPQEVLLAAPLLRRMVRSIDLDPETRVPRFTFTGPVAETLNLARSAGAIPPQPEASLTRPWLTPSEVGKELGWSRSTVSRRLREGAIPYVLTGGRTLHRYRVPRQWVDERQFETAPVRSTGSEEGSAPATVAAFARRTGLAYRTVLSLARSGRIPATSSGAGRRRRYLIPASAYGSEAVNEAIETSRIRRRRRASRAAEPSHSSGNPS